MYEKIKNDNFEEMSNPEDYNANRILDYIDGLMTSDEASAFEKEIQSDKKLNEEVNHYRYTQQLVIESGRSKLRATLNKIGETIEQNNNSDNIKTIIMTNQKKRKLPLFGLVGMLAIAVGAFVFLNNSGSLDPQQAIADNYNPKTELTGKYLDKLDSSGFAASDSDTSAMVTLPNGDSVAREDFVKMEMIRKESLSKALKLYKSDKYAKARIAFYAYANEYVDNVEDRQLATFYLAKSMLNTGDYKAAADTYQEFLDGEKLDKEIMDVAEFDRAISWIQLNPKEAMKYLKVISLDNGHTYQSTSKSMVETLF
jgi:TolA-binding protein